MLTKETLQTALENVENMFLAKNTSMGDREKSRFKATITELKDALTKPQVDLAAKLDPTLAKFDPTELPYGNSQRLNRND